MCGQEGLIVLSTSGNMIGWQKLRVTNRSDHQRLSKILRSTSFFVLIGLYIAHTCDL